MRGGDETRAVRGWWVLATLAPFGLGSGPAFWYAGRRAGQPAWERAGWFWFGASLLGYLGALFTKHFWPPGHPFALGEMFVAWGGAIVHALVIRREYVRRVRAVGPRVERARNHAPPGALASLPGVGPALAGRIATARAEAAGFASVDELGVLLDLDPATVERIRERAVFLP